MHWGRTTTTPATVCGAAMAPGKWMFETQKLDEMRLDAVFVNLEHRYNVEFDIADDVGLEARLTLSLRSEPLEEILDAIALVVPIRYESSGGTIFITRR